MTNEEIRNKIRELIQQTFDELCKIGNESSDGHSSTSRIIFPLKKKGEVRYSEQELRFLFVEKLNLQIEALDWYYSVETPTKLGYKEFSGKGANPHQADDGQSAMIDLVIHNNKGERIALIEFKALNPDKLCYDKDFVKLEYEPSKNGLPLRFFIEYVISNDNGTKNNILNKKLEKKDDNTEFWCYNIDVNGKTPQILISPIKQ